MLPDTAAGQVEWRLSYQDLTDAEQEPQQPVHRVAGSFGSFTFIDPAGQSCWHGAKIYRSLTGSSGCLQTPSGIGDPLGTQRAWSISNASAASQALQQTLGMPGEYVACFSVYLRSDAAGTVTLVARRYASDVSRGSRVAASVGK